MTVETLFQPSCTGGGNSSGSGQYVKDQFLDTSRMATNNDGFTSTFSTNPLSYSFANDDSPRYGIKTFFIKDLQKLEDRTQWIDNKPTYEIIFSESTPYVRAYVYGNVRLRKSNQGQTIDAINVGDGFGVTGVIRQVAWILNGTNGTGTCARSTDAVAGSNLTFGSLNAGSVNNGVNLYNVYLHNSALETNNIHDYRISANQYGVLSLSGLIVYTQNATTNIDQFPGSTYIDKELSTTLVGTDLDLPVVVSPNGAKSVVNKLANLSYEVTTVETPYVQSVGVGASGGALLDVTTGHGASFPVGSGIVYASGSSFYIGMVTNQSTDTLTVTPALYIGVSGTVYKSWMAGSTIAISASLYCLKDSVDFTFQNNFIDPNGFGVSAVASYFYSDPEFQYRAWGRNLTINAQNATPGLGFNGNTAAFFQVDGNFSAAEIEVSSNGIFNGIFSLNGVTAFTQNFGSTGIFKQTVFSEAGPGWNSFVFTPGQSYINCTITKLNLYEQANPIGVSYGVLASFDTFVDRANREANAVSATLMPLGGLQRTYADSLYLTGIWTRGTSYIFAGGAAYFGASTNSQLSFKYYGTDFAFLGTQGGSMACTLDGASIAFDFNVMKSAALGWHDVSLTYQAGATAIIAAVDYVRPDNMELKNEQNYKFFEQQDDIPKVYVQSDTPRQGKNGDIWIQKKKNALDQFGRIWFRIEDQWAAIVTSQISDDPNLLTFFKAVGTSNNAGAGVVADGEQFNNVAWSAISATGGTAGRFASLSQLNYGSLFQVVDGLNSADSVYSQNLLFNKFAWSTGTNRGSARQQSGGAFFVQYSVCNKGSNTSGAGGGQGTCDAWNGAWASLTAWGVNHTAPSCFVLNNLLSCVGGSDTGSTPQTLHQTRTLSNSIGSATVIPAAISTANGAVANGAGVCKISTTSYAWNGSAWSGAITNTYQSGGYFFAGNESQNIALGNGGYNGSTTVLTSEVCNGVAFTATTSSATARGGGTSAWI